MKIVHLFANNKVGGAEIYAINLATAALNDGHEASFIVSEEGALTKRLTENGISFVLIRMDSSFNPFRMSKSVFELKNYFQKQGIAIVHTHMLREHSLAIGAKFLGTNIKVVRTFHRLDQFNWKMKPLMWFYNWQTDAFIAITEYLQKYLVVNGTVENKISVILNGVSEIAVNKHDKAIGFLGRLASEKGTLKLLKNNSIELVNNSNLVIAGTGPDELAIKKYISEKGFNTKMMGEVSDLNNFFENISVLVLPSDSEVLPLSILEAFSAGVPVVSFDLPSLVGVLTENNSITVASGKYEELLQAACELLSSTDLDLLSRQVKAEYSEKYTLKLMWQKTFELYKSL